METTKTFKMTEEGKRSTYDRVVMAIWDEYMKMYAENDHDYEVLHTEKAIAERKAISDSLHADMKALNVEGY